MKKHCLSQQKCSLRGVLFSTLVMLPSHCVWAQSNEMANNGDASSQLEDVTVIDESEAEVLAESARSVSIIETEYDQNMTADMGEVLARTQGVGVRRSGGLGSGTRFSLNGLTDDQIRFFVDGIPLEFSGYVLGVSNIPVNLVEHVEIYQGVVPVQFGADALGGAVNMVTNDSLEGTHGAISHQLGAFGTQRSTLNINHLHEDSGFFARFNAYADSADNEYDIDVEVPDEVGRPQPVTVKRFNDDYTSRGGALELGLVGQSWADRLQLSLYSSQFNKDIQHNSIMTVPYGEARFERESSGINLRYLQGLSDQWSLDASLGQSRIETNFLDVSEYVYDWYGNQIFASINPGEIAGASNSVVWSDSHFARINLDWIPSQTQQVKLSLAPTWNDRTGKERLTAEGARDPLTAERELLTTVVGLEHTVELFDKRLQNIFFLKHYYQKIRSEEPVLGTDSYRRKDRDTSRNGWGEALRYRFSDWLYGKLSYEYATRLPRANEIFGDAVLIYDNLDLEEEESHNFNLGLTVEGLQSDVGIWRADVSLFVRDADNLIVLLGSDQNFTYQNVYSAVSKGIQASGGWSSSSGLIDVDANVTSLDFRNTSSDGAFSNFHGDRIPNRPYLFANASVRLNWFDVLADDDELSASWNLRFVEEFYRGWESVGLREFKHTVPEQVSYSFGLTYSRDLYPYRLNLSAEVQNLTDEKLYDFFGVQRPGRAFYLKATFDF